MMNLILTRYVPGLILRVSNKLSSSASQLYGPRFGVGLTDWRVLSYFELQPWSTAAQACELVGFDKAAVSRSVAFLQGGELLKSRPFGLRKIQYSTTASGKALYNKILKVALAREEALLTGISDADRETFIRLLHRVIKNLDAVQSVGRDENGRSAKRA